MNDRPTDAAPAGIADAQQNVRPERPVVPAPLLPPALLRALDEAAAVAAELEARRLSLHFEPGDEGRVRAQVVDAGGQVVRELPIGEALKLLSSRVASSADTLGPDSL